MSTRAILLALVFSCSANAQEGKDPAKTLELGKGDRIMAQHKGGICGLSFSPDGKFLATGGGDALVRLWNVETGKESLQFTGHKGFIRRVVFTPDSKLAASGGNDTEITLWDPNTGKEIRRLAGHQGGIYWLVFSPDGKTLASGGFDEHLRFWDITTGQELHAVHAHSRVVYAVAFSPDGKQVATGGDNDGTVRLWDAKTYKEIRRWTAHEKFVYTLCFTPNGKLLLSGGDGPAARLWETTTAREVRRFDGHDGGVIRAVFAPDGRTLLTASYYRTAHLWELVSGRSIRSFGKHGGVGWVWGLSYSPTARHIATAGDDGIAVVWSLDGVPPEKPLPKLTAKDVLSLWQDLAATDAGRAYQAIWALSAAPGEAVPLLRDRLHPVESAKLNAEQLARWIANLDHPQYTVRDLASRELENLGPLAGPALQRALSKAPSLEAKRRMQTLIDKMERMELSPEELRARRALQILETINNPEARKVLAKLATGVPEAAFTQEAQEMLQRLEKHENAPRQNHYEQNHKTRTLVRTPIIFRVL